MTFLAMLLLSGEPELCTRRCPRHPFRSRLCLACQPGLSHAAAVTVLLFAGKLRDTVADERRLRRLAARLCLRLFASAEQKARRDAPEFAAVADRELAALAALERAGEQSFDRAADPFARISAAACRMPGGPGSAAEELLYQTGRMVYLADALEDVEEDTSAGRYNPVTARFGITRRDELIGAEQEISRIAESSMALAADRFMELAPTAYTPIVQNILLTGIPSALRRALYGPPEKGAKK